MTQPQISTVTITWSDGAFGTYRARYNVHGIQETAVSKAMKLFRADEHLAGTKILVGAEIER